MKMPRTWLGSARSAKAASGARRCPAAGRLANGFLLAGVALQVGPAGVVQALGGDQREVEDAARQPQDERQQTQALQPAAFAQRHQAAPGPGQRREGRVDLRRHAQRAQRLVFAHVRVAGKLAALGADERGDAHHEAEHLGHPAGGEDAHHGHHQQAGKPCRGQRQQRQDGQHQGIIEDVVAARDAQAEEHRQAEEQHQAEIGQDGLQQLGEEHGADGYGRGQQELHIASQIQRLQQHAEAGEQDAHKGRREDQGGDRLDEGRGVSHISGQRGRAQEAQQQEAQVEDQPQKAQEGQRGDAQQYLADQALAAEGAVHDQQANAQQLPHVAPQGRAATGGCCRSESAHPSTSAISAYSAPPVRPRKMSSRLVSPWPSERSSSMLPGRSACRG